MCGIADPIKSPDLRWVFHIFWLALAWHLKSSRARKVPLSCGVDCPHFEIVPVAGVHPRQDLVWRFSCDTNPIFACSWAIVQFVGHSSAKLSVS